MASASANRLTQTALGTRLWWLIIGALLAPVIPGGWITVLAAILVATAPLLALVQRFNGAYPSKFTRVWVFRPFWYLQLASLLMALAGAAGFLAGAPFGAATVTGRGAGLAFTDWPLMHGRVIPDLSETTRVLQFSHRVVAALVGLFVGYVVEGFALRPDVSPAGRKRSQIPRVFNRLWTCPVG